jgi:hypothetical protein
LKSTFVVPQVCGRPSRTPGLEVEARIDAGARRERLEPQPVEVARHDWVGRHDARRDHLRRLVVAAAGDLGDDEQRLRGLAGLGEEPREEVGMCFTAARSCQRHLGFAAFEGDIRWSEIRVRLLRSGHEIQFGSVTPRLQSLG